jgi:hypothetical protein
VSNRPKASGKPPPVVDRDTAVAAIARHLADRDSFVIGVPPFAVDECAERLADIPSTFYADSGIAGVLVTNQPVLIGLLSQLGQVAVVATVPKTVPASALSDALGQRVPRDGSRDLILLQVDDGPARYVWPMLLVDAISRFDPKAGLQIRATDLAAQS